MVSETERAGQAEKAGPDPLAEQAGPDPLAGKGQPGQEKAEAVLVVA